MSTYNFDVNSPALQKFFEKVSTDGFLDPTKFMLAVKKRFGILGDSLLLILATFFDVTTPPFSYRGYA